MPRFSLILLLFIFAIASCVPSRTSSSAANNTPTKIIKLAVKDIERGKSVEKNKETINSLLRDLLAREIPQIKVLTDQTGDNDYLERAVAKIETLTNMMEPAKAYLNQDIKDQLTAFKTQSKAISNGLNQDYFAEGSKLFSKAKATNDKKAATKAYTILSKAKKYGNTSADLDNQIAESKQLGTVTLAIFYDGSNADIYKTTLDDAFNELEALSVDTKKVIYNPSAQSHYDESLTISLGLIHKNNRAIVSERNFKQNVRTASSGQNSDGTNTSNETVTVYARAEITKTIWTRSWTVTIKASENNAFFGQESKRFEEVYNFETVDIQTSGNEQAIPEEFAFASADPIPMDSELVGNLITQIYEKLRQDLLNN